jgi:putative hydrolase of the HAD superfamily
MVNNKPALGIKAVVFDYGQVISLPQEPGAMDRLAKLAGVERDKFESRLWALREEYDRGTVSGREYYRQVLSGFTVNMDDSGIDEMLEIDLNSWKNINSETVALMEDVKKAGYTLGILSNMPCDFLSWARKNIPVFSLPQISLFSCELNLLKPEKAIYQKLLSALNMESGELVFFDDNTDNIKSARELGIRALLWENCEIARRQLLSLGVTL